jgi:uncharacterized membrane protein
MKRALSISELTQRNVETIANLEKESESSRTFGERVADAVARTVGSWPFIVVQSLVLLAWMVVNVVGWLNHWDPYPFILLNLLLSFQAAYASPIIMMSQNRQEKLNDRRNQLDLQMQAITPLVPQGGDPRAPRAREQKPRRDHEPRRSHPPD